MTDVTRNLLDAAQWECCFTAPGAASGPSGLDALDLVWRSAAVPGTAASAWASSNAAPGTTAVPGVTIPDVDTVDWWFRCRFRGEEGTWSLELDGLATIADVWCNGAQVLHSENMFVAHRVPVDLTSADNELTIRCAALAPALQVRRPRPRFKSSMVNHQALRWFRTTYLGRQPGWTSIPPPVGPWRPVRIEPVEPVRLVDRHVVASCRGDDGVVTVRLGFVGTLEADSAVLRVGGVEGALVVVADGDHFLVEGQLVVPTVERWWPHTHGPQPRYEAEVEVGGHRFDLGQLGFRTVTLDRWDGGFSFVVNDVPIFCAGACWWPVHPVEMTTSTDDLYATLRLVVDAHMNMVRIPGATVYEDERFWDACDELGIMVWQDAMIGYVDPPDDAEFLASFSAELDQVFSSLGGRPSLAVVCGGQELEEQAAMSGAGRDRWEFPVIEHVRAQAERLLPGTPFVTSSPTGGDLPFQADVGDCHYWGVGSLLRPLQDACLSGMRFMSEGLAFAIPPEQVTVDDIWGGPMVAGHDPAWKAALHHDNARPWDLEDVRDYYVGELFGLDAAMLRYLDAERALDLGRATVAELMSSVFTEWRRPGSTCRGALLVALRDFVPGAGWGVVDALGRPKAPYYGLRRVLAPRAVLLTDEGINGLAVHVVNDTAYDFEATLRLELFAYGEHSSEHAERLVEVPAHGGLTLSGTSLFDGFRDLSYAYRYGPVVQDVVAAQIIEAGEVVSEFIYLPGGPSRPVEPDVGLEAKARPREGGGWALDVTTKRLAQWVVVEVDGYRASDSWFHLPPGRTVSLGLVPDGVNGAPPSSEPSGRVRAVNARASARVTVEHG